MNDNVIWLASSIRHENRAHAIANAAQAAQLLEQDRTNMRIDIWNDLAREKRQLLERLGQIETAMSELAG